MSLHVPDGHGGLRPVGERAQQTVTIQPEGPVPTLLRPMTESGSTTYPHGRTAVLLFGITGSMPNEVFVNGRPAEVVPISRLTQLQQRFLQRYSAGVPVLGAIVWPGSPSWGRGMQTASIRMTKGGFPLSEDVTFQVY